ncbi:MAG: hypothetical protein C0445_15630 [Polaromonas sp.]|nr:hypothetical protein [Polaromonas sp.]
MSTTAQPSLTPTARPGVATLPSTDSLPAAARAAALRGKPLVVMTTLNGCPYCDVVRGHYLAPMTRAGDIHAIQLDMTDRRTPLLGFDGRPTTAHAQIKAWQAPMAPTVLFLGPTGEELAERLVGIAVQDLYGDYLNARLQEATVNLGKTRR